MAIYVLRRVVYLVPVIFIISILTFTLMVLLGPDPGRAILGLEADAQSVAVINREMGADKPLVPRYFSWMGRALHGDLGISFRSRQSVTTLIAQRLPVTAELGLMAMAIALLIALPVGIISALKPNSIFDTVGTFFAVLGVAVPNFWLGLILVLIFALALGWFPAIGFVPFTKDPLANLKGMLLPAFALGTAEAAVLTRMTRSSLVEVLSQEYIVTARAKGLTEQTVVLLHALKNSLIPVVTILGLQIGRILGGTVIIETVFALPGMGRLGVDSIFFREFMVVQGVVLVLALGALVGNLLADLAYGYLDPRIKYA